MSLNLYCDCDALPVSSLTYNARKIAIIGPDISIKRNLIEKIRKEHHVNLEKYGESKVGSFVNNTRIIIPPATDNKGFCERQVTFYTTQAFSVADVVLICVKSEDLTDSLFEDYFPSFKDKGEKISELLRNKKVILCIENKHKSIFVDYPEKILAPAFKGDLEKNFKDIEQFFEDAKIASVNKKKDYYKSYLNTIKNKSKDALYKIKNNVIRAFKEALLNKDLDLHVYFLYNEESPSKINREDKSFGEKYKEIKDEEDNNFEKLFKQISSSIEKSKVKRRYVDWHVFYDNAHDEYSNKFLRNIIKTAKEYKNYRMYDYIDSFIDDIDINPLGIKSKYDIPIEDIKGCYKDESFWSSKIVPNEKGIEKLIDRVLDRLKSHIEFLEYDDSCIDSFRTTKESEIKKRIANSSYSILTKNERLNEAIKPHFSTSALKHDLKKIFLSKAKENSDKRLKEYEAERKKYSNFLEKCINIAYDVLCEDYKNKFKELKKCIDNFKVEDVVK